MFNSNDLNFEGAFIFLLILAVVVGWAVIEFILWLFSFVTISIG